MEKANSPGRTIVKEMNLKSKWKISLSTSFLLIGLGLYLFCEAFYRLKTVAEKSTWTFFLLVSTIVFFIGLYLFSLAISYDNKIKTKKLLKKQQRLKHRKYEGSEKLEIQKNPQK